MKQYLLNIYQPDGVVPAPELLEPVMRDMQALVQDAKDAGVWVFNGGLHPASASTVVRVKGGRRDGDGRPLRRREGTHRGLHDRQAPDLDAALEWARKIARVLTLPGRKDGLAIEVRPFHD